MEFRLFVSNVPYHATDEEFKTEMKKLEGVVDAHVVKKPSQLTNRGYGFMTVATKEDITKFISKRDVMFQGRVLKFTEYVNQHKLYRLHVSGLTDEITEPILLSIFSNYGSVENVKRDPGRTTALVIYNNHDEFKKVLDMGTIKYCKDKTTCNLTVEKRRAPMRRYTPFPYFNFPAMYIPSHRYAPISVDRHMGYLTHPPHFPHYPRFPMYPNYRPRDMKPSAVEFVPRSPVSTEQDQPMKPFHQYRSPSNNVHFNVSKKQ